MTAPLADRDLARVLAEHAPAAAPTGLRARIGVEVDATPQQRRAPALVAPLVDTDPFARRRALLLAAALLAVVAIAGGLVVGALLRDRPPRLSLNPPDDPGTYLVEAYQAFGSLPAFEMRASEQGAPRVVYSDGRGNVRVEMPDMGIVRIVTLGRVVLLSEDPNGRRVAIDVGPTGETPGRVLSGYSGLWPCGGEPGATGCDARCSGPTVAYTGLGEALGRPVHRIRCGGTEYWIDVATRLPLRAGQGDAPAASPDPSAHPSAAPSTSWEVRELRLGPQPAELFSTVPPAGYERVAGDDPACLEVWFAECTEPYASRPYVTPPPAAGSVSEDAGLIAARVREAYEHLPPLVLVVQESTHVDGDPDVHLGPRSRYLHDGEGRYRTELGGQGDTIYLAVDGHTWNAPLEDGRRTWRDGWGYYADHDPRGDIRLDFPERCMVPWMFLGADVVAGRETFHVACGTAEFWVDREQFAVLRTALKPTDPLDRVTRIREASEVRLEAAEPELFRVPDDAVIQERSTPTPEP